jgi:adenylate cyclase class IV
MANVEYEYSFKVDSVKPYIEYCENKGYTLTSKTYQNRVVYENKHSEHIIARVTKTKSKGVIKEVFDCKNVGAEHKDLKISNESIPMVITDENRDSVSSILEVLDFHIAANNIRNRYVYEKGSVKFEIDDYLEPKSQVVAIEGKKTAVDKVYQEILKTIKK